MPPAESAVRSRARKPIKLAPSSRSRQPAPDPDTSAVEGADPASLSAESSPAPAALSAGETAPAAEATSGSPIPAGGLFLIDHVCVFDRHWYVRAYPDVALAGLDPATHYRETGYKEGRAPNRFFDPDRYRELNPDLVGYDGDLLMHYVFYGAVEGRRIS